MANEELKAQGLEKALHTAYELYLTHGIDQVTKEMIAKESGLSVRTVHRYFADKTDCITQVIRWAFQKDQVEFDEKYDDALFNSGKYTAAEILRMYMTDVKNFFLDDPRRFILYTDYKLYTYYNRDEFAKIDRSMERVSDRRIQEKIYELGQRDGSFSPDLDFCTESSYLTASFFGLLTNLSISFFAHSRSEMEHQIDERIQNTIALYTGEKRAYCG
jgi:AcrR family transcriptional regulator